jgi:hypothetical protein
LPLPFLGFLIQDLNGDCELVVVGAELTFEINSTSFIVLSSTGAHNFPFSILRVSWQPKAIRDI